MVVSGCVSGNLGLLAQQRFMKSPMKSPLVSLGQQWRRLHRRLHARWCPSGPEVGRRRGLKVEDVGVARTEYRPWLDRVVLVTGWLAVAAFGVARQWFFAGSIGLLLAGLGAWHSTLRRGARRLAEQPGAVGGWWSLVQWPDDVGEQRPRRWVQILFWSAQWVYLQATPEGLRVIPGKLARRLGGFPILTLRWTEIAGAFEMGVTNSQVGVMSLWQHAEICLELVGQGPEVYRMPTPEEIADEELTKADLVECELWIRDFGRDLVGDRYHVGTYPWVIYTQPGTDLVAVVSSLARAGK